MNTLTDRALSIGAAIAVVSFISSLMYQYPDVFVIELPRSLVPVFEMLCISFIHEGKLQIITWAVFFTLSVSCFGFLYLVGAIYAGMQKLDGAYLLTHAVVMLLGMLLLLGVSGKNALFYAEIFYCFTGLILTIYLLYSRNYQEKYLQYLLVYTITIFFATLGTSYALLSLYDVIVLAVISTALYTLFFWCMSMFLIFIREWATL